MEACFHVGSIVSVLSKIDLGNGSEQLMYGTLSGTLGVLSPFSSQALADSARRIEDAMRENESASDLVSLLGRDHISYRSKYYPLKSVVDGDLCEMFSDLTSEQQSLIANQVELSVPDLFQKLQQFRRLMF